MYGTNQLGVGKGMKELLKFDRNELRYQFHCGILIPRKCPRKTPFKARCPPPPLPLGSKPSTLVMIVSENVSYTRYTRAFCHVGLPSTLATAFWTKSKNIQQKGASRVITKRPAHICQIPATIHNGERLMQHQKPKNTATRMREKKKEWEFEGSTLYMNTDNSLPVLLSSWNYGDKYVKY